MAAQPTGSQTLMSASMIKFTWTITNFTQLTETEYYSRPFTVDICCCSWRVQVYPKGRNDGSGHLSLFLAVADSQNLPDGWATTSAFVSLTVVNQSTPNSSLRREVRNQNFCATSSRWGYPEMITLEAVHNDGFLVNDTLIIEVCLVEERQVDTSQEMIDSYFSSLEQYINDVPVCCLRSPSDAQCPTLEEVEDAKRSLKGCLSDLFKLNMKDRLAEALSTLSMAELGLPAVQTSSVRAFLDRFGQFTSDLLGFEQVNAEFELQQQLKVELLSDMKKCHEQHVMFKKLSKQISEEEAECKRKMVEIHQRKEKLESDWKVLLAESHEAKCKHAMQEKKAKDAEERMSRSATAWSSLMKP